MANYFLEKESVIYCGERWISSINGVGKTGYPHAKQDETGHCILTSYTKINSKWI